MRCSACERTFTPGVETCACPAGASAEPLDEQAKRDEFDRDRLLASQEMRSLAKRFDREARRLLGDDIHGEAGQDNGGTARDIVAGCKCADVSIKAMRAAMEFAAPVAEKDHDRWLAGENRAIKGVGPRRLKVVK